MNPNPYSLLDPVTNPDMFYGYRPELEYIVSRVTALHRASFFVIGGSRMGKTSLLRQIEHHLKQPEPALHQQLVMPLYLDMLQMREATLNDFFGKVGRLLIRHLVTLPSFTVPSNVKTSLQSLKTDTEPFETFNDALYELAQAAEPVHLRIVFLIDDLWRTRQETNSNIVTSLRGLYTEPSLGSVIAYVITGSHHEINAPDSPLENVLMQKPLHVFDEEQSLALINEPTEGQIPPEVAQRVYSETGGHPFLIQCLMSELCEYEDLSQLTVEAVDEATAYFLRERRDFERWWEKLSEADRRIYEVFRQNDQASVESLRRMMLSIPTEGGRSQIVTVPMIRDSLRSLSTMGLIRELEVWDDDTLYELAGQWYARWSNRINRTTQQL